MKKTMVVLFLILCILLVSETAFAKGKSEENYKAVMGSSSLGGTWYSCACKIGAVAEQYEGLNITVQATGGGAENIRLMAQNEAQLGLAEPSIASYAYNATSIFQGDPHKDIRFITDLYPNALCAMVMKSGDIKTFEDLKTPAGGKKKGFCFGSPGSGDELVWIEALSGFGITKDMLDWRPLSHSERVTAFKDRQLECLGYATAQPSGSIMEASAQTPIRLLAIGGKDREKILKDYPWYDPYTIKAGMYNGVDEPVETISIGGYVIVNQDVPEEFVYKILKAMYSPEGLAQVQGVSAGTKAVSLETALGGNKDGKILPFHPGAIKFYKEKGMIK